MKNILIIIAAALLFLGGVWWSKDLKENQLENKVEEADTSDDLISKTSIHWHPELTITIKGEKQTIPSDIGIGMQYAGYPQNDPMMMMTNMHTHDASGMIHWEVMEGPVKKDDVRLSQFFAVWGKTFTNSCIFEYCNGSEGRLVFKVNGEGNQEFENYPVKDKDKIEIIFQ